FLAGKFAPPDLVAGALVEGNDKSVQAGAKVENHEVAVDDRAAPEAPDMLKLAKILLPDDVAAHVVGVEARGAVPGDDPLAVAHRRSGAEGIRLMCQFLFGILDLVLPQRLTGVAVKAMQAAERAIRRGVRNENF